MPFDLQTWKASLRQRLPGWKLRMTRLGVNSVYATISAAALWPVVEAAQRGEWAALAALGGVVGSVGGNLLANQLQEWKDKASAATQLAQAIPADPALRAELDAVLARLDALAAAREALPQADRCLAGRQPARQLTRRGQQPDLRSHRSDDAVIAQGPGGNSRWARAVSRSARSKAM